MQIKASSEREEMTAEQLLDHYGPVIKKVSAKVIRDYPMWTREDIEQELYAFVLYRNTTIPRIGESKFSVQAFLTRVARTLAFDQKRQHYIPNSDTGYSVKNVREILWTHFDISLWESSVAGESIEDRVAAHSDIAWSLDRMKPEKKMVIRDAYLSGEMPKSTTTEYSKLREALIELTNILNTYSRSDEAKSIGRRAVISNANANAIVDHHTSGSGERFDYLSSLLNKRGA